MPRTSLSYSCVYMSLSDQPVKQKVCVCIDGSSTLPMTSLCSSPSNCWYFPEMFSCHIHILWYSMTEIKCPTRSKFKVSCWFYCKTLSTTALCSWCWRRGPDRGLTTTRRAEVGLLLRMCCRTSCLHGTPFLLHHQVLHLTSSSLTTPSL